MTVRELGQQLRSRQISCVELIQQVFADIKQRDTFRSLITLTEEQALHDAAKRDQELAAGKDRGPFHGIPVAVKDLFYTRGIRTTGGSLVYKDFIPEYDATVVEQLRTAGAVSIGKTNLHEIAFGITSKNPHFGFVLNPLDPKRIPGGSSGGSAALIAGKFLPMALGTDTGGSIPLIAGGFLPMALGTDTGGSIRVPASYCGITGIKPTYGRVSRHGVLPLAFSLDHVGPLGSCVEDCALAMQAIADGDFTSPDVPRLEGVRVGVAKNFFFERVDSEVASAVRKSIAQMERLGAALVEVQVPDLHEANAAARVVQLSETAAIYVNHTDPKMFGQDVWALLEQGRMIMGHEYVNAQRVRTVFRQHFDALWREVDVMAVPTTPITAPLLEQDNVLVGDTEENTRIATTRLVRAINFLGEPALSMPCGKGSNGMPIGLQLISAPFTEGRLLQIAKTLEAVL